jgi:ankyrin repeat protein
MREWGVDLRVTALLAALSGFAAAAPIQAQDASATPVVRLVATGERDAALARLKAGADVGVADADGTTALQWAAHQGDAELVQALLRAGADVRTHNAYGYSPMIAAAEIGDAAVLELLLRAGADVESANAEGQTSLMAVARTGRTDAAALLLKHGAKVDARERWGGQTALMWAAAQGNADMVRLLLKHRADPNARATVREWPRRVTAEPRPKDMNRGGLTALLYAAREDCRACALALLRGGADVDMADPDGVTPLILALINVRWDMARLLIDNGANIDLWDFYGQTPLYAAVDMNTLPVGRRVELPAEDKTSGLDIIRLLLDRGANANAQLKLRIPHRQVAYDRYTEPMLNIGATPLLRAAKAGDVPVLKLLLEHGALPNLANMNGDTPLMAAVGKGWVNVPTRGANYTEDQALDVYALLRAAGADVQARTNFNETALHSAALRGWHRVIRQLIADGAQPDAEDRNGLTPLDFALDRVPKGFNEVHPGPREDTAALLRTLGARVEHPNLPPWPAAGTPRITARVPSDSTVLPPF